MSLFSSPIRVIQTSLLHLRRNTSHSVTAVLVMTLTLFVISVFVMMALGMNVVLSYFESQPRVTAFFMDTASAQEILSIKQALEDTGEVEKITYISKDEALARYKEQNKNEPVLLEMVTADMLPASLEVSANNPVYLPHLAEMLSQEDLVEEVAFHQDVVETIQKWTNAVRVGGIAVGSVFIIASVLIVLITISTNIAARAEEIEVMRLVGASASYIRWPFILEGMIYGVTAALISVGFIYLFHPKVVAPLSTFLAGIPIFPISSQVFLTMLLADMGLGILIGVFGSSIAVTRRLKV